MSFAEANWREQTFASIAANPHFDVIVIGGGITGAGLLREASRAGLRALLIEQQDFASGTSSRSSKMVHGGLRYLAQHRLKLTRDSVQERQRMMRDAPDLVRPLGFLFADYSQGNKERRLFGIGLKIYDRMAGSRDSSYLSANEFQLRAPHISPQELKGGFRYLDAKTDDARLVFRVIQEAVAAGGMAINYAKGQQLRKTSQGGAARIRGVTVVDQLSQRELTANAAVVINATGVWADRMRQVAKGQAKLRPLRGSHLVFPAWRLPAAQAICFMHPGADGRAIFATPWEGCTLVGTTDLDHDGALGEEPKISQAELDYLMHGLQARFPALQLSVDDVISAWAGVRPVIDSGEKNPSDESRHHEIWDENGLLTVTGGKLTTFRLTALEALNQVRDRLPGRPSFKRNAPILDAITEDLPRDIDPILASRLRGRYGNLAAAVLNAAADADELNLIPGTETWWLELRWAARAEAVQNLQDLLLRRTRLGWLLADGAAAILPRVLQICREELAWDEQRCQQEAAAWQAHGLANYQLSHLDLDTHAAQSAAA